MDKQVWAVGMVRDESEIIGYTLAHLFAEGIDGAVVADNLSTDGTRDLLHDLSERYNIVVVEDDDPAYRQSQKITRLANLAYTRGACWIIPFDADELHYSTLEGSNLAQTLRASKVSVINVPLWNHFATGLDSPTEKNPYRRELWRALPPNPLNKVVCQWQAGMLLAAGYHSVNDAQGRQLTGARANIEIRHLQNRSTEHLIRKIRNETLAYAAAPELSKGIGYWWKFNELSDDQIREWWEREYYFPDPQAAGMVFDPPPYRGRL